MQKLNSLLGPVIRLFGDGCHQSPINKFSVIVKSAHVRLYHSRMLFVRA